MAEGHAMENFRVTVSTDFRFYSEQDGKQLRAVATVVT